MEPKFEIQYYINHQTLAEFYRKIGTGPRYPWIALMTVFLAIVSVDTAAKGLRATEYMLPIVAFVYALMLSFPHIMAWSNLRRAKRHNDGTLPKIRITFGNLLEVFEGTIHITAEYCKIVRVVRLKHSYVLMIGKRNGLILDPNAFTKGTFEEFKQFIREKRPDLNIPE